ncbi:MAG: hypothetical protein JXQ85_09875 [Cognatishimia sp.]|uniref:mevalonate kinase family protein n=1 Tax=Cognatishimia sp. TaxID=2211648 RepID=UPI003B8BB91A
MIRATAPGSIMITGEHAVVYGHKAIVAAIEQRITVMLSPRADRVIRIQSEIAEPLEVALDDLPSGGDYRFILAAIARHKAGLATGFDLTISSEINPTLGLGSSAAVTVATLGALLRYQARPTSNVHAQALSIVQEIQGRGSGADLAASFKGGMLAYQALPSPVLHPLPTPPQLSLRYCGYKTPTAEVLRQIATRMVGQEAYFKALYEKMGTEADIAIEAAETADWAGFAQSLTTYQALMEELGVCDDTLAQIISEARSDNSVLAAKISGSGLGDCVLAVGNTPQEFTPVTLAKEGLLIDE